MKIVSILNDERINATSVLLEMTTEQYLELISGSENNLEIQRKIVKGFKPYERLREDLKRGCIIPPLVVGVKNDAISTPKNIEDTHFISELHATPSENIFIIDGLQRTNALQTVSKNLYSEDLEIFLKRKLRVEVWPDITLTALTYRMILLNAGQKPMSLKWQLEVVSVPLCNIIQEKFHNRIEIFREKDGRKRNATGQYQFSLIAQSFQTFSQESPHIDIRNEVVEKLKQDDVMAAYGESLKSNGDRDILTTKFVEYINFLLKLDEKICTSYHNAEDRSDENVIIPSGITLLSRDTFHLGLSAAYGWCLKNRPEDLQAAVEKLFLLFEDGKEDPLSLYRYEKIQQGFLRKDNVGEQTRTLTFNGFKEYFRSSGIENLEQCWIV